MSPLSSLLYVYVFVSYRVISKIIGKKQRQNNHTELTLTASSLGSIHTHPFFLKFPELKNCVSIVVGIDTRSNELFTEEPHVNIKYHVANRFKIQEINSLAQYIPLIEKQLIDEPGF